jgi:hypothetical protein
MIPAEDDRAKAQKLALKIILHPQHKPVDFQVPLEKQMRVSISKALQKVHNKPAFIDTAEKLLAGPLQSDLNPSDDELVDAEAIEEDGESLISISSSCSSVTEDDDQEADMRTTDSALNSSAQNKNKLGVVNLAKQRRRKRKKKA